MHLYIASNFHVESSKYRDVCMYVCNAAKCIISTQCITVVFIQTYIQSMILCTPINLLFHSLSYSTHLASRFRLSLSLSLFLYLYLHSKALLLDVATLTNSSDNCVECALNVCIAYKLKDKLFHDIMLTDNTHL